MLQNEKNRNCKQKPLLLFSPLDWGLGHLTRSIPLLKAFKEAGWKIAVACNSTQKNIIQAEIYGLDFYELQGYGIVYSNTGWATRLKILGQSGKILMQIKRENHWLRQFVATFQVNLVVSDNRYGFYHPHVPSVLITHQLQPRTGFGVLADRLFQKMLYQFMNKFSECWIPDSAGKVNLAGSLSHPTVYPKTPLRFLGPLTRMQCADQNAIEYDLLIILSGPEPQRSILEKKLLAQLVSLSDVKALLIRGLPGTSLKNQLPNVTSIDHASSTRLCSYAQQSRVVICRSGYTSLMDMMRLKKKMIIIPTPGQAEQEYLARYFMENKYALSLSQKNFSLRDALVQARDFNYVSPELNWQQYLDQLPLDYSAR